MTTIQLRPIDYLILGLYFAFVLGIGFALKRYTKSSTDFFLSGRSIPAWVAGLAFLANGVTGHLAARRLRREPLPVLHVLVREGEEDGRTYVFAADDTEGRRSVLCFHSLYAS